MKPPLIAIAVTLGVWSLFAAAGIAAVLLLFEDDQDF